MSTQPIRSTVSRWFLAISSDIPSVSRYVTSEEKQTGEIHVTGLTPSTLYTVNVYDTSSRVNTTSSYTQCRSAPPVPRRLTVEEGGATDDLSVPDCRQRRSCARLPKVHRVYDLPQVLHILSPLCYQERIRIAWSPTGDRPVIVMNGTWSTAANANIASFSFENVELRNQADNQYFFNSGNPFRNGDRIVYQLCRSVRFCRGFWRHQVQAPSIYLTLRLTTAGLTSAGGRAVLTVHSHSVQATRTKSAHTTRLDNLTIRNTNLFAWRIQTGYSIRLGQSLSTTHSRLILINLLS